MELEAAKMIGAGLAAIVFLGVTVIGFVKHGIKYLNLFVPKGVPIVLLPVIV